MYMCIYMTITSTTHTDDVLQSLSTPCICGQFEDMISGYKLDQAFWGQEAWPLAFFFCVNTSARDFAWCPP